MTIANAVAKVIVEIENVSKEYQMGEDQVHALKNIEIKIEEGVFLAITGPSGSGKSTLLNLIGCIDTPSTGKIRIDGRDVTGETPDRLADLRARTIRFRLSDVQPAAGVVGRGERRVSVDAN